MENSANQAALKRKAEELIKEAREHGLTDEVVRLAAIIKRLENPPREDAVAMGEACRETYIRELSGKGIRLIRIDSRIYETASGRRVGIAYATERRPDKWFMGLPDEKYDVVVLLCQQPSGNPLDFVLPTDFVRKAWPVLARSGKERKINVKRTGVNYELEPGKGLGKINQYLSNFAELT